MILRKHIASRFLNHHDILIWDLMKKFHPEIPWDKKPNIPDPLTHDFSQYDVGPYVLAQATFDLLAPMGSKNYWVTESVFEMMDFLKIKPKADKKGFDWDIFKNIPHGRYTFIFPKNSLLRMIVTDISIRFMHLTEMEANGVTSKLSYVGFCYDRATGNLTAGNKNLEQKDLEEGEIGLFVYKLLCFMFLTENDVIELKPGQKSGTKKSGKVINTLSQNITIVNSRWNTTVIRTEGFGVSGHLRLQPCGKGRERTEIIYIAPFKKHGYIRRAKAPEHAGV